MGWPVDAIYQALVSGTTVVSKAFGDEMQTRIMNLFGGSKTVKKFQVDGTGDAATTVAAGDILASAGRLGAGTYVSGTALPTTTVPLGYVTKDLMPLGWGLFNQTGVNTMTVSRAVNVKSMVANAIGDFTITFATAPPHPATCVGFACGSAAGAVASPDVVCSAEAVTGCLVARVRFYGIPDAANVVNGLTGPGTFQLVVFGS